MKAVLNATRRLRLIVGAAVAILAVGGIAVGFMSRPEPEPWRGATGQLALAGPDTIDAGELWTIEVVDALAGPTAEASLTVTGPWGSATANAKVTGEQIEVPVSLTRRSGWLLATVRSGDAVGTIGVEVRPGPAIDGTTPLAGPRSMIADTEHWTMVTSFPRDRFGNVVADGTSVDVLARHPDGSVEIVTTEVEHLLAAPRVYSRTLAGRTSLRLDVDGATGEEIEVLEVPGPPASVEIIAPTGPLRADGRQLVTVRTDDLNDRYGNELLDGTAAVVEVNSPSGRSTLRTRTIDGRAEFTIEAPDAAGWFQLEVIVGGVRSGPVVLAFDDDVSELPVSLRTSQGATELVVGPVLTSLGGFVPDGTVAQIDTPSGRVVVVLEDGRGVIELDVEPGDEILVDVLGVRREVVAP